MAYLNDYKTPSNPTNFPPIAVAAGTLANFTVASPLPPMPDLAVTKKYLTFRRVGPDLTLNTTNAPWLSNVLKLEAFTAPLSGGANAQTSALGSANGQTAGGTLKTLVQGATYKLVAFSTNGWLLPQCVEVLVPTISSIGPLSAAPGDVINITGTNLLSASYVIIGGASAAIDAASVTSTNVAVTVPLLAATGANIPVVVITGVGVSGTNTALTIVSGSAVAKLTAPVVGQPTNITNSGFTISWPAVTGADGYRVRLNGSTLFMPGNVSAYTFTGLPANTLATADVQALDSTNTKQASNYSATVSATTTAGTQVSGNYASQDYFSQDYNA